VTLASPLAVGTRMTITSGVPELQEVVLVNQGGFYPDVISDAFDRITILTQQVKELTARSLKFPSTDLDEVVDLPSSEQRAGRFIYFGVDGALETLPVSPAGTLVFASDELVAEIQGYASDASDSAAAAAASEATLVQVVQPVSTVQLNKVTGASPDAMPMFQMVNAFRMYSPVGESYYKNGLKSWDAGQGAFCTFFISGYDAGTIEYSPIGLTVAPFSGTGAQMWGGIHTYKRLGTPYEAASVTVAVLPTYTSGQVSASIGLWKDNANWIMAFYNFNGNKLSIRASVAGTVYNVGEVVTGSNLAVGDKLAMIVDGAQCYALQTKPDGTQFRSDIVNSKAYFNLREIGSLESFVWSLGLQSVGIGNVITYRDFTVSEFDGVGMRDFSVVTYEDGTPYEEEGLYYVTATCAGYKDSSSDAPYAGAYMGVFSFDPLTYKMQKVGRILWTSTVGSTYICGHHAGQVVFNRNSKAWIVTASTFGLVDVGDGIRICGDIRYSSPLRGTCIAVANPITFPIANFMWDAQWMLVGSTWYIAVTVSDSGTSKVGLYTASLSTPFTIVAGSFLSPGGNAREGTKLVNTGNGTVRLLAGETNTNTVHVYLLAPFTEIGTLTTPNLTGLGQPAQHFDLLQHYNKGTSEYFAFLFGTDMVDSISNTWGTTMIARNGNGGELNGYGFDKIKVAGRPA